MRRTVVCWLALAAMGCLFAGESLAQDDAKSITGRVTSVKPKEMTVTIKGAQRGERQTITISPDTKITLGGQPATIKDIKRGHMATFRYRMVTQGGKQVAVAVRVPDPTDVVEPAPLVAQTPPAPTPPRPAAPVRSEPLPPQLPKTASPVPLIGLAGWVALALAGGITAVRRSMARRAVR